MVLRNVPGTIAIGVLAGLLAGCELTLIDPHFGQDMSVSALGDDRWEVRALTSLSQSDVFAAVREECGGEPIVESRETRDDDPTSVYMTVRCLRPHYIPPPGVRGDPSPR